MLTSSMFCIVQDELLKSRGVKKAGTQHVTPGRAALAANPRDWQAWESRRMQWHVNVGHGTRTAWHLIGTRHVIGIQMDHDVVPINL